LLIYDDAIVPEQLYHSQRGIARDLILSDLNTTIRLRYKG
jgi:hypothetical protein